MPTRRSRTSWRRSAGSLRTKPRCTACRSAGGMPFLFPTFALNHLSVHTLCDVWDVCYVSVSPLSANTLPSATLPHFFLPSHLFIHYCHTYTQWSTPQERNRVWFLLLFKLTNEIACYERMHIHAHARLHPCMLRADFKQHACTLNRSIIAHTQSFALWSSQLYFTSSLLTPLLTCCSFFQLGDAAAVQGGAVVVPSRGGHPRSARWEQPKDLLGAWLCAREAIP